MKIVYTFIIPAFLFFSCAASQNIYTSEAKQHIEQFRHLIRASPEQTRQLIKAEAEFLNRSNRLLPHADDYRAKLDSLRQKRKQSFQKILSRDQYIKLDMIENNRLKSAPVRVQ